MANSSFDIKKSEQSQKKKNPHHISVTTRNAVGNLILTDYKG
jgi:hypothetical protein